MLTRDAPFTVRREIAVAPFAGPRILADTFCPSIATLVAVAVAVAVAAEKAPTSVVDEVSEPYPRYLSRSAASPV